MRASVSSMSEEEATAAVTSRTSARTSVCTAAEGPPGVDISLALSALDTTALNLAARGEGGGRGGRQGRPARRLQDASHMGIGGMSMPMFQMPIMPMSSCSRMWQWNIAMPM